LSAFGAARPAGRPMGGPGGRPGDRPGGWRGSKFAPRRKVCSFCAKKVTKIDYKESSKLSRYISDRGKIEPRRKTGTCARHQRALAMAIKRARHIALLPFTAEHIRMAGNVASLSPAVIKPQVETPEAVAAAEAAKPAVAPEIVETTAPEVVEPAPEAAKPAVVEDVESAAPEAEEPAPETVKPAVAENVEPTTPEAEEPAAS
jgi:small subunit ribosomal protein S18